MKVTSKDKKLREDEILEELYMLEEEGTESSKENLPEMNIDFLDETIEELQEKGLVKRKDFHIFLTDEGRKRARAIIRRHRLAEVLFREVFDLSEEGLESSACTFEHIISSELVDRLCTFLSHPTHCPHGRKIPEGECCRKKHLEVQPLVERLSDVIPGKTVKIHYITPSSRKILHKLSSIGVIPGIRVKLLQKNPAFVLDLDGNLIALDKDLAQNIYVISEEEH